MDRLAACLLCGDALSGEFELLLKQGDTRLFRDRPGPDRSKGERVGGLLPGRRGEVRLGRVGSLPQDFLVLRRGQPERLQDDVVVLVEIEQLLGAVERPLGRVVGVDRVIDLLQRVRDSPRLRLVRTLPTGKLLLCRDIERRRAGIRLRILGGVALTGEIPRRCGQLGPRGQGGRRATFLPLLRRAFEWPCRARRRPCRRCPKRQRRPAPTASRWPRACPRTARAPSVWCVRVGNLRLRPDCRKPAGP